MLIRVCDFETTGIPCPEDKHAIVEAGWCDLLRDSGGSWRITGPTAMLVNPGRDIPIEAMAIHHIRNADIEDAESPTESMRLLATGADVYCAHNIDFEKQFFGGGDKPWVCTYKSGLRLCPDAPRHTNQVLRYYLDLDSLPDFDPSLAQPPHRAGPDAYVTAHILRHFLDLTNFDDLVRWSSGPALLIRVGFGKHFNKKWAEVPVDYLQWIVGKSDISDRDVRATAKHHLKIAMARANSRAG
jgi:exodeoxyribonuclease X